MDHAIPKFLSAQQHAFMVALLNSGELIFAGGKKGYSANIVGTFHLFETDREVRLDMGDGTNHIHVNWSQVAAVEIRDFHGEGHAQFSNPEGDPLFSFFRPAGPFDSKLLDLAGDLSAPAPETQQ